MTIFRHGVTVRRRSPTWQTAVLLVMGLGIGGYAIRANERTFRAAAVARLTSAFPAITDGDTIRINGVKIRIIGIDAPDTEPLRQLSGDHLRRLAVRDGGMTCSIDLFASLTSARPCRAPATSYGRDNLSCVFNRNGADVAATITASSPMAFTAPQRWRRLARAAASGAATIRRWRRLRTGERSSATENVAADFRFARANIGYVTGRFHARRSPCRARVRPLCASGRS